MRSNNKVTGMSAPVRFVMAIPYILMHRFLKNNKYGMYLKYSGSLPQWRSTKGST